jgi:tRNA nucleotidyltransferase (CCA-adding enzyme)
MAIKDVPEVRKPILKYLTELKDIKPLITGKDLLKMGFHPGPEFSEIFRKILYEKLRGKLQTKEEEIEFVKSIFY